jgi:hypothetical protein
MISAMMPKPRLSPRLANRNGIATYVPIFATEQIFQIVQESAIVEGNNFLTDLKLIEGVLGFSEIFNKLGSRRVSLCRSDGYRKQRHKHCEEESGERHGEIIAWRFSRPQHLIGLEAAAIARPCFPLDQ